MEMCNEVGFDMTFNRITPTLPKKPNWLTPVWHIVGLVKPTATNPPQHHMSDVSCGSPVGTPLPLIKGNKISGRR